MIPAKPELSCSKPRVLITGVTSIHGWPIFERLRQALGSARVFGLRPPKMRIPEGDNVRSVCMTDRETLARVRDRFAPDLVIHSAGVCDLDVCEERTEWAHDLNVNGAANIVDLFADRPILFVSTDLVFSGENPPLSGYSEDDPTDPISVVGRTFRLAEDEIARAPDWAILRLGLPTGDSIQGKKGAIDWIENRFRRGLPATLFHDEWRSCIDCDELSACVFEFLERGGRGLYHLGGPKAWSLHAIAERVLAKGNYDPTLLSTCSRHEEVNGPPRVGNLGLDSKKIEQLLGRSIRPCRWHETSTSS